MSYNIADFSHRYIETGVIKDYNFVLQENPPPDDIDMDDPKEHLAWLCNPRHPTYGNILIDSSSATIEKLQATSFETISWILPLLLKMPLASKQLVSFQNCQWIYISLQTVWTASMKATMFKYQELHDNNGILLWFCFLKHIARTTTENLIEAYPQLSENKL